MIALESKEVPIKAEKAKKLSRRNTPVACSICSEAVRRRDMDKHKLTSHHVGHVTLTTRTATKSASPCMCSQCGELRTETWRFPNTSRGAVNLCKPCKRLCLKDSFGREAQIDKRLENLKGTLREIKGMLANPDYATMHARLKEQVKELELTIERPHAVGRRWSPILPGSYGSGSRR